jgi:hypothetical protein
MRVGHPLGYARVSTTDQQPHLQVDALDRGRLIPGVHVTATRARTDRPVLEQVLDQLRPGDALVVWKLDRLGRSLRHLVEIVAGLAERGGGVPFPGVRVPRTVVPNRAVGVPLPVALGPADAASAAAVSQPLMSIATISTGCMASGRCNENGLYCWYLTAEAPFEQCDPGGDLLDPEASRKVNVVAGYAADFASQAESSQSYVSCRVGV